MNYLYENTISLIQIKYFYIFVTKKENILYIMHLLVKYTGTNLCF